MNRRPAIVLTPRAFDDLTRIRDYLMARSPHGAENVRLAINATLEQLQDFPLTGRYRPELGVRSISVARYPYTIYHRVHDDHVEIAHVRDNRRKPVSPGDV
jgi:plasmid stabilization system protein ParE